MNTAQASNEYKVVLAERFDGKMAAGILSRPRCACRPAIDEDENGSYRRLFCISADETGRTTTTMMTGRFSSKGYAQNGKTQRDGMEYDGGWLSNRVSEAMLTDFMVGFCFHRQDLAAETLHFPIKRSNGGGRKGATGMKWKDVAKNPLLLALLGHAEVYTMAGRELYVANEADHEAFTNPVVRYHAAFPSDGDMLVRWIKAWHWRLFVSPETTATTTTDARERPPALLTLAARAYRGRPASLMPVLAGSPIMLEVLRHRWYEASKTYDSATREQRLDLLRCVWENEALLLGDRDNGIEKVRNGMATLLPQKDSDDDAEICLCAKIKLWPL